MPDVRADIGRILDARAAAIRRRDADAITADIARDVVEFDLVGPLRIYGVTAVRDRLMRWFNAYEGPIGCEVRDLVVRGDDAIAFSYALMRFTGTLKSGTRVDMWVRSTIGWQRRDGRWTIVHEHTSGPMDADTEKTRIDLRP